MENIDGYIVEKQIGDERMLVVTVCQPGIHELVIPESEKTTEQNQEKTEAFVQEEKSNYLVTGFCYDGEGKEIIQPEKSTVPEVCRQ